MVARIVFIGALCLLAFLWGGLSTTFKFFPYRLFVKTKLAYDALTQIASDEFLDRKPTKFEELESEGLTGPTVRRAERRAGTADELILVNGGYYQMMSECPRFGCLAWIMDRTGRVRHVWEVDPKQVWGDVKRLAGFKQADNIYPVGMHLYPDGDLLVTFQARNTYPYAVGIARFDRNSVLRWKVENLAHHWLSVGEDGLIYVPSLNPVDSPMAVGTTRAMVVCKAEKVYEDLIRVYTDDGRLVETISVTKALLESGYPGLIFEGNESDPPEYVECDPTHLNDVRVLSKELADEYPELNPGDILISMRNNNTLAVIDRATRRVKKVITGKTLLQHSPIFVGQGRIIVLDNLGGPQAKGGSRVARLDLGNGAVETLFPRAATPDDVDFYTHNGGRLVLHPSGRRALVGLTRRGRVLEVDLERGDVLWEYVNTHDLAPYLGTKDREGKRRFARFSATEAYYVISPSFPMNRERNREKPSL